MDKKMFCFQCEQTAAGTACTGKAGVCGKQADTAALQDKLTSELIDLALSARGNERYLTPAVDKMVIECLFATVTNVNFDNHVLAQLIDRVEREKARFNDKHSCQHDGCQSSTSYHISQLWNSSEDIRSLKSLILFGLRGMSAYAYHADVLGYRDEAVAGFFYKALCAIGSPDAEMDALLPVVLETGAVNLRCMELLDRANTETFGSPEPRQVSLTVEKGPFIVISGHDLYDLKELLEQTEGTGINVYTHGEMLPAHSYPGLNKYPHLKGNFGTAWQNQQTEFADIPAPVLFTTNCLMPPRPSYMDRVFSTEVVAYPGVTHIGEKRSFTPVIQKALSLGGYARDMHFTGINGGESVMTGFGHHAVLSAADTVIAGIREGLIRHIFLVGGCDGAKPGRNYYTEFVQKAPEDSLILTLACGKYRFNDLNLGTIGGLPRLLDMGQCNDAYSAIKVSQALAAAFKCGINDLPLTLVLSWYEQKAVCILLTLLHLGMRNIWLGPSLPAFLSPNVLAFLVEKYNIMPISTPEKDLPRMMSH